MRKEDFFEVLGALDDDMIQGAKTLVANRGGKAAVSHAKRWQFPLVAAIMAVLLIGSAMAVALIHGDLWIQKPSNDPVETVRSALENQAGKDYVLKIEVQSVEIDEAETERMTEWFLESYIAERRGWSAEYLAEHFFAVKAVYYAEYDRTQTTRSDGEVTMYFYVIQDVDSGAWTIVDNSGNVNRPENDPADRSGNLTGMSTEEQLFSYLSGLFSEAYSPYYDGLHYKISDYTETADGDEVTATFLWTMYFLGKGWDIGTDEGVEQEVNYFLQATAAVDENGALDFSTISVLADESPVGDTYFNTPIEEYFPK